MRYVVKRIVRQAFYSRSEYSSEVDITPCLRALAYAYLLPLSVLSPGTAAEPVKLVSRGDSNAADTSKLLRLAVGKAGVTGQLNLKD